MRIQKIMSSADVEKLKQKARKLKKDGGMPHHQALDAVARTAGFHQWHHVSDAAKAIKPTEQAYCFGVIIAMDVKDAMDFRDASGRFVEDDLAFDLCAKDIYEYSCKVDGDDAEDDPDYGEDKSELMQDMLSEYVFFRYSGSDIPERVDDVVSLVRECSFWPPQFIWHKGTFQECPSDHAIDDVGEVVEVRFK